jgi:phosphopantothenoylcysteine synthetase/decarboxylase
MKSRYCYNERAVADYTPKIVAKEKIKKSEENLP